MIGENLFNIVEHYDIRMPRKSIEALRVALNHNPSSINDYNDNGDMPIHFAVRRERLDLLRILIIEGKADFYAKNKNGETIQKISEDKPHLAAFIYLLEQEAALLGKGEEFMSELISTMKSLKLKNVFKADKKERQSKEGIEGKKKKRSKHKRSKSDTEKNPFFSQDNRNEIKKIYQGTFDRIDLAERAGTVELEESESPSTTPRSDNMFELSKNFYNKFYSIFDKELQGICRDEKLVIYKKDSGFFKIHAKPIKCRIDFLAKIYECCTCVNRWDEKSIVLFDPQVLRERVIGLLACPDVQYYKNTVFLEQYDYPTTPYLLIKGITTLYTALGLRQKHILIAMMYELLSWDFFYFSFDNPIIQMEIKKFYQLMNADHFLKLTLELKKIVTLKCKIYEESRAKNIMPFHVFCTKINFSLGSVKSLIESTKKRKLGETALILANDIRAITHQFYISFNPTELVNFNEKGKELPEFNYPNLSLKIALFDSITFFFINLILNAKNQKNRLRIMTLVILTMDHLICHRHPDFEGASAVLAALNFKSVERLTTHFQMLHKSLIEKIERANVILQKVKNYCIQRALMLTKTEIFPSIGIYIGDFTLAYENPYSETPSNDLIKGESLSTRYDMIGQICFDLFYRKAHFSAEPIKPVTDLLTVLMSLRGMLALKETENTFLRLSNMIQLNPISLADKIYSEDIELYLSFYKEKNESLIINYKNATLIGNGAIEAVVSWLKSLIVKKGSLPLDKAIIILKLAYSTLHSSEITFSESDYVNQLEQIHKLWSEKLIRQTAMKQQINEEKGKDKERKKNKNKEGKDKNRKGKKNKKGSLRAKHKSNQIMLGAGRGYHSDSASKKSKRQTVLVPRRMTETDLNNEDPDGFVEDFDSSSSLTDPLLLLEELSPRTAESEPKTSPKNDESNPSGIFFNFTPRQTSSYSLSARTFSTDGGFSSQSISPRTPHEGELRQITRLPSLSSEQGSEYMRSFSATELQASEVPIKQPEKSPSKLDSP